MEALIYIFESGDFWAILLKVLITALLTGTLSLLCTLMGKLIIKLKNSKLKRQADIAVKAAEIKFPNEGTKMGPQKMAYVMDYLAITFPKIKSNQYLYNIAEAAVYELNREKELQSAKEQFEEKYGELPEAEDNNFNNENKVKNVVDNVTNIIDDVLDVIDEVPQEANINAISTAEITTTENTKILNIF